MNKLPAILREVFDVRDTPAARKWAWRVVWVILGGVILLGLLLTYQGASAAEFVPLSIRSLRYADYSADEQGILIPAISMELVEDLIRDQEPTDVAARLAAVQNQLENSIPTATPRPTDTPSGDPTEVAFSGGTATFTPTSTAASFATFTPTSVISDNDIQATNGAATATSAAKTSQASVPTSTSVQPTSPSGGNPTATFTKAAPSPTPITNKPSPTPTSGGKPTSTPTTASGTVPSSTPLPSNTSVPSKTPGSVDMTATTTKESAKTTEPTASQLPTGTPTKAPTNTPKPTATSTVIADACKDPDPKWGFVDWTNPEDGDLISPERSRLFIQFSQPINVSDFPKLIKLMGPGNLKYEFHYSEITRILVIDLKSNLEPGTEYKLVISKNLENYCGKKQDVNVEIDFATWDWSEVGGN